MIQPEKIMHNWNEFYLKSLLNGYKSVKRRGSPATQMAVRKLNLEFNDED